VRSRVTKAIVGAALAIGSVAAMAKGAGATYYQVYSASSVCTSPNTFGGRVYVNGIAHRHHLSQTGWDTIVDRNTSLPLNSTANWVSTSGNTGRNGTFSGQGLTVVNNFTSGWTGYNICYG
jgi:hypothetical protein